MNAQQYPFVAPKSRAPSKPSLVACIAVAIAGACLAYAMKHGLWPLVGGVATMRLITIAVPVAYALFLLALARTRSGRLVLGSGALLLAGALLVLPVKLWTVLLCLGAMVWLIRSFCYRRSVAGALLDGGVAAGGFLVAGAVLATGHGAPTAVWAALLSQAVFVYLPDEFGRSRRGKVADEVGFDRAFGVANQALRQLATRAGAEPGR